MRCTLWHLALPLIALIAVTAEAISLIQGNSLGCYKNTSWWYKLVSMYIAVHVI